MGRGESPFGFDSRTAHMRHRHALHDFAPLGAVVGEPAQRAVSLFALT